MWLLALVASHEISKRAREATVAIVNANRDLAHPGFW